MNFEKSPSPDTSSISSPIIAEVSDPAIKPPDEEIILLTNLNL